MLFQLNIMLTEEDYLAYNNFHSFESAHGKKQIRKSRIAIIAIMAFLLVFVVFMLGWTPVSIAYTIALGLFTALYMLLFKKILNRNIKAQIKQLKKIGKLPFDPVSTLEFYEDKMVDISASKRTEQGYNTFERICVVKDRYILLYQSSVGAYILPMPQIKAQVDQDALLTFLAGKCNTIEHY